MRDETCIFCKIANGEIPSATVYEDMRLFCLKIISRMFVIWTRKPLLKFCHWQPK